MNRSKDTSHPITHWFRNDLRLSDNPALAGAAKSTRPVVPVYILEDKDSDPWTPCGASRWWLYHSIVALNKFLEARGNRLILRRGPCLSKPPMRRSTMSIPAVCFTIFSKPPMRRSTNIRRRTKRTTISKPPMRRSTNAGWPRSASCWRLWLRYGSFESVRTRRASLFSSGSGVPARNLVLSCPRLSPRQEASTFRGVLPQKPPGEPVYLCCVS